MEVNILSKTLIKPFSPTPSNLKNYHLSCHDKVMGAIEVSVILFCSSSPNNDRRNAHLEESLAKILPEFYPFAGRYVADNDHLVDCSDQGIEFAEAQVDAELLEFVKEIKSGQVSDLLPKERNSLLCIQATTLKCGGVVIGVCMSHIFIDASSLTTFMAALANACSGNKNMNINPIFHPPTLLPHEISNTTGVDLLESRNNTAPHIVAKMFVFNKETIASLKSKIRSRASRVRVVCALIARALIRLHGAKSVQCPVDWLIVQAVNMRERIVPPLPKHSCGNFSTIAHCKVSNNMGFEELVEVLGEAIVETIGGCADRVSSGESVHQALVDPVLDLHSAFGGGAKLLAFTDYTKFGFYDIDFGWGKPVQTSIGTMPTENHIILMGNREGDGVEAWVRLNHQDMALFEQDEEIITFATWIL